MSPVPLGLCQLWKIKTCGVYIYIYAKLMITFLVILCFISFLVYILGEVRLKYSLSFEKKYNTDFPDPLFYSQ